MTHHEIAMSPHEPLSVIISHQTHQQSTEIDNRLRSTIDRDQQSTENDNQLTEIDWLNLIATGKPFWLVFQKVPKKAPGELIANFLKKYF